MGGGIKIALPTRLCLVSLPPGCLQRRFGRLWAQEDFPFIREAVRRGQDGPAAQQQGAQGRRVWLGGRVLR